MLLGLLKTCLSQSQRLHTWEEASLPAKSVVYKFIILELQGSRLYANFWSLLDSQNVNFARPLSSVRLRHEAYAMCNEFSELCQTRRIGYGRADSVNRCFLKSTHSKRTLHSCQDFCFAWKMQLACMCLQGKLHSLLLILWQCLQINAAVEDYLFLHQPR